MVKVDIFTSGSHELYAFVFNWIENSSLQKRCNCDYCKNNTLQQIRTIISGRPHFKFFKLVHFQISSIFPFEWPFQPSDLFFFFSLRGTRPEIAHYWFGCIILTSFWNTRTVMKFSIYYLNVVFQFTLIPLKLHVFIKFFSYLCVSHWFRSEVVVL